MPGLRGPAYVLRFSQIRDEVDFHPHVAREPGGLNRRARRRGRGEELGVDLVHRGELRHIHQLHRRLDDGGQDPAEVLQDAARLGGDAARDEGAGRRVDRNLAGGKQVVARADGLAVGADRGGRLRS